MATKRGGGRNYVTGIAAGLFLAGMGSADAQTSSAGGFALGTAHVIEWDLSSLPDTLDGNPGAMVVDTRGEDRNRVWFITRLADPAGGTDRVTTPQRIYRFDPSTSLYKAAARWFSWELHGDVYGGGIRIRPSHDRRFVFARTTSFIQRVDTQNCTAGSYPTCERTVYSYPENGGEFADPVQLSDIAIDDTNRVFTTGLGAPGSLTAAGYVQMLNPSAPQKIDTYKNVLITAKRWPVNSGSGTCIGSSPLNASCIAGIDIHPSKQNLVYYTEFGTNSIAELDVNNLSPTPTRPNIRRWVLSSLDPTIQGPRMLKIDRRGRLWINTQSGHLVSLDPSTSKMTKHPLPDRELADPFAIAPDDDVIGYTAAGTNKVGMLFPKFAAVYVGPMKDVVPPIDVDVMVNKEPSPRNDGTATPEAKIVVTDTASCNGTCVEANVDKVLFKTDDSAPSLSPLGITPNMSKAQGTFFYTVGFTGKADFSDLSIAKRLGFVRLPNKEKIKNGRDDDDCDDGFDRNRDARWHNSEPGDADADGVPDQYDTNTSTDNMTIADPVVVAVGQSGDYPAATSATTLALIAAVTPDVATATIAVDVYNALGALVGTSGPIVGVGVATIPTPGAGNYKIRVRNLGTSSVSPTPTIVIREPLIQQ
jgi:hypothetical protein